MMAMERRWWAAVPSQSERIRRIGRADGKERSATLLGRAAMDVEDMPRHIHGSS